MILMKAELFFYVKSQILFISEVSQMSLRLANGQKLGKRMILQHAFYPILHLWKDHTLKS